MEQWIDLDFCNGDYSVSSLGNVRSNLRHVIRKNGKKHLVKERSLKPATDASGYKRVGLTVNGKLKTYKVHRLVMYAFVGASKLEVNHVDGIKHNNQLANLEYCNRSENVKHAFSKGLAKPLRGSSNPTAKINEIKAITIKTFLKAGYRLRYISDKLNVSYNIVKDISRNKTWKHV